MRSGHHSALPPLHKTKSPPRRWGRTGALLALIALVSVYYFGFIDLDWLLLANNNHQAEILVRPQTRFGVVIDLGSSGPPPPPSSKSLQPKDSLTRRPTMQAAE